MPLYQRHLGFEAYSCSDESITVDQLNGLTLSRARFEGGRVGRSLWSVDA